MRVSCYNAPTIAGAVAAGVCRRLYIIINHRIILDVDPHIAAVFYANRHVVWIKDALRHKRIFVFVKTDDPFRDMRGIEKFSSRCAGVRE